MELIYPVDLVVNANHQGTIVYADESGYAVKGWEDTAPRLPVAEIAELNRQLNVNFCDECDEWFDEEYVSPDMHIVDEDEFFDRFCN